MRREEKKEKQDNLNKQSAIEEGRNMEFLERSIYVRMYSSQKTR